ncbi:hypothetical protein EDC04DRAFT_2598546 [Pisolithus marmoratus]|nr:hypothetical protein EDC04DRAFT_2598546 [Pisolithus marmoratus]
MAFCPLLNLRTTAWQGQAFLEDIPRFFKDLRLSGILVIIFCALLWLSWTRSRRKDQARSRAALRALLTVITPSCSLWPSRYTKLVKNASIRANHRIALPLNMVIQDVLEGVIEFRDPLVDLVDLTRGIEVNGWNICVHMEWKLWVDAMGLWLSHKADRGLGIFGWPTPRSPVDPFGSSSVPSWQVARLATISTSTANPFSSVRNIKPGGRLTLEFTSLSMGIRPCSATHILALLPFILCSRDSCGPPRRPRQLSRVLDMLSQPTKQGDITVHSATNMSILYQQELLRLFEHISENGEFHKMLINAFGIRRWRQQRFSLALEAVLVRRGLIEKWAIEASV